MAVIMIDNIYAPPKADMADPVAAATSDDMFYVVSQRKFTVLYIATLGAYEFYWFYRQWRTVRDRSRYLGGSDGDIWPLPRAIFSVFFVHALFSAVAAHAAARGQALSWKHGLHATLLVIMLIASNILTKVPDNGYVGALSILAIMAICYSECRAQGNINKSCGDPEGSSNRQFTWHNYACIALGGLVWAAILIKAIKPALH